MFAGSPAHRATHAPRWPIVNIPCAMMPSNPTIRATSSSWCERVLVATGVRVGAHVLAASRCVRAPGARPPRGCPRTARSRRPAPVRSWWNERRQRPCRRHPSSRVSITRKPLPPLLPDRRDPGWTRQGFAYPQRPMEHVLLGPVDHPREVQPSSGSPMTCGNTVNSAAVRNVGGTPGGPPNSSWNARTRSSLISNATGRGTSCLRPQGSRGARYPRTPAPGKQGGCVRRSREPPRIRRDGCRRSPHLRPHRRRPPSVR